MRSGRTPSDVAAAASVTDDRDGCGAERLRRCGELRGVSCGDRAHVRVDRHGPFVLDRPNRRRLIADFKTRNRLQHAPSGRHYAMLERGGALVQRRHEIGFDGKETNVVELEAGYVVGSGNHAQTFLHRKADGRLLRAARQLV